MKNPGLCVLSGLIDVSYCLYFAWDFAEPRIFDAVKAILLKDARRSLG